MGFKTESRTQEWFNLAIERELQHTITPEDAGHELRALAREERPHLILKAWHEQGLLELVYPLLARKHPDYDAISHLLKVRDELFMAGFRPRLATPMMLAILGHLKDREIGHLLSKLGFRAAEIDVIGTFPRQALAIQKDLAGKKTKTPVDAYHFIEKLPMEVIAYLLAESNNSAAVSKLKAYLNKWRPIRQTRPIVVTELEALGMPRGPQFDRVINEVFAAQLYGRGKTPEEREKMLRKLSGIKEARTKKEKERKPAKTREKHAAKEEAKAGIKAAAERKKAKK